MFAKEAVIVAYKKLDKKIRELEKEIQNLQEKLNLSEETKIHPTIDLKVNRPDIGIIRLPIKHIEETLYNDNNGKCIRSWNIITMSVPQSLKEKIEGYSITPKGEEHYLIEHPYFDEEQKKFVREPIPEEFYETKLYLEYGKAINVKHVGYINFTMNGTFEEGKYWDIDMQIVEVSK